LNGRRWLRLTAKALHDIASIAFGGGLAACLVINLMANRMSPADFATSRQVFAAISQYILIPSVAVVVASGLIAMMATRGYQDAGWAWVKAVLGISLLVATFRVVGASTASSELLAAAADPGAVDALLRAERGMLWLLIALCVVNVVLAVWRPKMMITIR
jgi:hypothetical protein